MKFLWCCIVLAVLNYSECQLVHTPVQYVAVTPAPRFYYSTASPFQQSPIHVTIENDIVYADKEQQQPRKPTIISRTFHGNPNLKTFPAQQQQQPIPLGNQNNFVDSFNTGSQTVSLERDQDVNIHAQYDQEQNTQNHQQQPQPQPQEQPSSTTKKPKTPSYRHHKYEVRRPAIKKQFYDVEEIVRIRPVGSAVIELDQPVSNTQPQEQFPAKNQTKSDPIAQQMRQDIDANKINGNQQFFNYEFVAQNNNNNENKQKQEVANGYLPPPVEETPDYPEDNPEDEEVIEEEQEEPSSTTPAPLSESDYNNNEDQDNNDQIPQYDYDEDSVVIEADPSADYPSTRGAVRTHINETSKQLEFGARINKLSRVSSDTSGNPRALNCDIPPQSAQRSANYGHYLNAFGYFPSFGSRNPNQFVPETPEEAEYIPQGPTISQQPQQPPQQPRPQPPQQPGVFVQYVPQGRRVPTYTPQFYPQYVPQDRSQPGFYPNYYPQYVPQQPQQPRQYPQQPRDYPQQPRPQPQPQQPRQNPQQPREFPQPQQPRQNPQQPRVYPQQPRPQPQPQQPRQNPQQPQEFPQPQQPRQNPQQPRVYPQQPRPQPLPQQPRQNPQQPREYPQPEQPVYIPQRPSFDPLPNKPAYIPQQPPVDPQNVPRNPNEGDQPVFIPAPIPAGPTHVPEQQEPTYVRPVGFYPQQPTERPQYGPVSPRFRPRFQTTTSAPFVEGTEEPDLNQFLNNNGNSSPEEDEENIPAEEPEIPSVETTSNGEAGNTDQSPAIVISRPDTVEDAQNNQRNYIRLLTERQNIAEVGFPSQQCGHPNHDGSEHKHINAGVVRTRVISATPAPKTAKTGERISHRRIVISTPVETVQEIDVIEPINEQEEDKAIPQSRSTTTTTTVKPNVPRYSTQIPPAFVNSEY